MSDDEQVTMRRPYIAIALAVMLVVGGVLWYLPERFRERIAAGRLGAILADWSWTRSVRLVPLRVLYFGILVVYGAVALAICRIAVDSEVVLSTIPLVLLAEGLPNFAGLGTRETSLLLLFNLPDESVLVAMSLFWSAGMLVIRLIIGLVHYWVHTLMSARVGSMK